MPETYSDNFNGTAKILWKVVKKLSTASNLNKSLAWLETHTNHLPPQPGDFKDLLEEFQFIPVEDPYHRNLYEKLESVLDDEELYQVMSMPLFDGTRGTTLSKDFWDQRAWM